MISLPNGCWRSEITVHPKDWDQPGAFLSDEWYLQYRFHDPAFFRSYPQGKLCIVKKGINTARTLTARRERIRRYMTILEQDLRGGFNPITRITAPPPGEGQTGSMELSSPGLPAAPVQGTAQAPIASTAAPQHQSLKITPAAIKAAELIAEEVQSHYFDENNNLLDPDLIKAVMPETPFAHALWQAYKKVKGVPNYLTDVRCAIRGVSKAAYILGYLDIPIWQVSKKHINLCLEACPAINPRWSNNRHNKYRAYLMALFTQLVKEEAVQENFFDSVPLLKKVKKLRRVITPLERKLVDDHLRQRNYTFWRFTRLFFPSGGREAELMRVQYKDIRIKAREYDGWVYKGRTYRQVTRAISVLALPLWQELLGECEELAEKTGNEVKVGEIYLFSKFLRPGLQPIRPDQVGRRWDKYVKQELGIDVDMYTLKHAHSDEIAAALGLEYAQRQNAHENEHTTRIYATGEEKRALERLKKVAIPFAHLPPVNIQKEQTDEKNCKACDYFSTDK